MDGAAPATGLTSRGVAGFRRPSRLEVTLWVIVNVTGAPEMESSRGLLRLDSCS